MFIRNKKDMIKNRNVLMYEICDDEYKRTRQERLKFLGEIEKETDKEIIEENVPIAYKELDEEIRKEIIDENIYKEIYCKNVKTIDNLINECNIDKIQMKQIKEDNSKKQEYINMLEEDNRKKQEYINMLEEKNRINEEKLKNRFFWKGKK